MLDGPDGVGLVFEPFGASGFGSGPGALLTMFGLRPQDHPPPVSVMDGVLRADQPGDPSVTDVNRTGRQQDRQRGICSLPRQLHLECPRRFGANRHPFVKRDTCGVPTVGPTEFQGLRTNRAGSTGELRLRLKR